MVPYKYLLLQVKIFVNCLKCTQEKFSRIIFAVPKDQICNFSNLAHFLRSYTRQYECDNVLYGFWGPEDGYRSETGSETVPGQIFASINFRGLEFIHEYSKNLYTAKIDTYSYNYD